MQELPQRSLVYSEAGGVTKSTTSLSLAVAACEEEAETGGFVMLVDGDPRGVVTKVTGAKPREEGHHLGAIVAAEDPEGWADEIAVPADVSAGWPANLLVLPSGYRTLANHEKGAADHAELRLLRSLKGTKVRRVFMDAPNRQGGLLTQSLLTACDTVVYATKPDEEGVDGLRGARTTVRTFMASREALGIRGALWEAGVIVGAAYKGAVWTRDARSALEALEDLAPGMVLTPYVPELVIVKEARSSGEFYGQYSAGAPVLDAYRQLYKKVRR